MKRTIMLSLFYRAISILLVVAFFSFPGERRYFSQAIGAGPENASSSPRPEQAALSPSEIVKRYWEASTTGKFSETEKHIDFCGLNSKYAVDRDFIKTLARLIPRSIYEGPEAPDIKPVQFMTGRITEAKIGQAINEIPMNGYAYVTTPEMRKSLSVYYVAEYHDEFQRLSEEYISSSNDSGIPLGAADESTRRRLAADRYGKLVDMRAQFGLDFAFRGEWGDRGQGDPVTVRRIGDSGKTWKEKLSVPYSVYFLDHVQLRAHLHATSTFLAATLRRSKPGDASSSSQNVKPGELVIGRIEEESLKGDTASVVAIIHFRDHPVTRSQFTLRRCKGEWKIDSVNFFYKDVFDLRKDLRRKENKSDIRKIASLPCGNQPVFRIPAAIPLIVRSIA
jgi:hypothetical protein